MRGANGIEQPRVAYFGHHNAGVGCLDVLIEAGADVRLVVTNRPYPGEPVWYASVEEAARRHGLPCLAAETLDQDGLVAAVAAVRPELLLCVGFRRMLPAELIELPRLGAFNLHDSLLPRYRGFTPSTWTIINGETETGVTLHALEETPDTGPIAAQARVPIGPDDTGHSLGLKLAAASQSLLRSTLPRLAAGRVDLHPQDEAKASSFPRRGTNPDDDRIDWGWPTRRICDLVRAATHPLPGAFTSWRGRRLTVWRCRRAQESKSPRRHLPAGVVAGAGADGVHVHTGDGLLLLHRVQPGKGAYGPVTATDLDLAPGEVLGG